MRRESDYERSNGEAARIVLESPARYGAGMVAWAQAWQARHGGGQQADPRDGRQMRLHYERAAAG